VATVADVEKERSALENVPPNLYESVCVPDLTEFLGGYHSLAGGDQKVANSGTSSGGGHPPSAVTPTPASNASGYLHDGKYTCLYRHDENQYQIRHLHDADGFSNPIDVKHMSLLLTGNSVCEVSLFRHFIRGRYRVMKLWAPPDEGGREHY
jgi:hypothetical protein